MASRQLERSGFLRVQGSSSINWPYQLRTKITHSPATRVLQCRGKQVAFQRLHQPLFNRFPIQQVGKYIHSSPDKQFVMSKWASVAPIF